MPALDAKSTSQDISKLKRTLWTLFSCARFLLGAYQSEVLTFSQWPTISLMYLYLVHDLTFWGGTRPTIRSSAIFTAYTRYYPLSLGIGNIEILNLYSTASPCPSDHSIIAYGRTWETGALRNVVPFRPQREPSESSKAQIAHLVCKTGSKCQIIFFGHEVF